MLWFLRLFSAFQTMELLLERHRQSNESLTAQLGTLREAHQELVTEKLLLQDRLEAALADKEHLWAMTQDALNAERNAMRMQVNHAVQKAGGGIPFPDAHSLPPAQVRVQQPGPVGRRGRILPSESVAQQNHDFLSEYIRGKQQ